MSKETKKIILDKDGKPCRSCNSMLDFQKATGKTSVLRSVQSNEMVQAALIPGSRSYKQINPPSAKQIGSDSWTLLHSITSKYSDEPTEKEKSEMDRFLHLFGKFYPVEEHGEAMKRYITTNKIDTINKLKLNNWMNSFHNYINSKSKKESFPTQFWEERWINGWE